MSASPLFCDHCGAANNDEDTSCCFCGQPLHETLLQSPSTPITHALPVDTLLNERYRIVAPLGSGGMSTVYRAQDIALHKRIVVVKELRTDNLSARDAQDAAEAFQREAALLSGLQHPNLPSIFEQFEQDGRRYLAMSFIQGEVLDTVLARSVTGKLPAHEVLQIGQQLCSALHYLHSQHPPIIYRDLKPANIIRAPDGQVYLIDFGVARRFKVGQHKDTVPFGSLGYAPPEQFGRSQTTPRSDMYSLGATLYQLLSGYEPDSTPLHFPPLETLEPALPDSLVQLITKMVSRDEDARPASARLVEMKLQEISKSIAPVQSTSFLAQAKQTYAQQKRRSLLAAVVLILVVVSLVIGSVGGGIMGTQASAVNNRLQIANLARTLAATQTAQDATNTTSASTVGTASANVVSTATGRATAIAGATATSITRLASTYPDPYPPAGTLALVDPLNQAGAWQDFPDPDSTGSCHIKSGGYQVTRTTVGNYYTCDENEAYTNFAIQVTITITQGDCGGLFLRENSGDSQFYRFDICTDQTYDAGKYMSNGIQKFFKTKSPTSGAIKQVGQANIVAVVANGGIFDIYVNGQKIDSITDTDTDVYSSGTIGLMAYSSSSSTTVLFRDVRIWTLP